MLDAVRSPRSPVAAAAFELAPDTGACRLCGDTASQRNVGPESYALTGQMLRRCGCCAAVYLAPDFTPRSLSDFYASKYRLLFPSETPWLSDARFFARRSDREVARARLARIAPLLPSEPRLFEMGSGFGAFLAACAEVGIKHLRAAEPDVASRAKLLNGADVEFCDALSQVPAGSLDGVVAFHVLEHLPDPAGFLAAVHAALKPSGRAFIEVPDLMQGLHAANYVHPAHVTYFTAETLSRFAQAAGFRIAFCGPQPDGGVLAENLWLELQRPMIATAPVAMAAAPSHEIATLDNWLDRIDWQVAYRRNWRRVAKQLALLMVGAGPVGELQRWRQWRRFRRTGWIGDHGVS